MTLSANMMIAYNDYTHTGLVVSNTSAMVANFGLENTLTEDLYKPAIFASNAAIITFCIDLLQARPLNLIALLKHNIMYTGKWRVQLNFSLDDPIGQEYDSGWIAATPPQPGFGGLAWGTFQWGDAIPEYSLGQYNRHSYLPLPAAIVARYLTVSIDAIANPSLIRLFRVWASGAYQPSNNVDYGAQVTPIDETKVVQAASGSRQYGEIVQRRQLSAGFSMLPRGEMLYNMVGGLYLASGISQPIIGILEPTDPTSFYAEAVYGNLKQIDPASYASWMQWSTTFTIDEAV